MIREITISAIIPVFNEEKNIKLLYSKLSKGLSKTGKNFEIIFVNDGSSDNSEIVLRNIFKKDDRVSVVLFKKNYGKNAALEAGIGISRGRLIVTLDSDLQHDPSEIYKLVEKIDEGYDLVTGWRKKRRDPLPRIFFSKLVNFSLFLITRFRAHDFYCGFKCYKRKVVEKLGLYGDLYRFIAYLAYLKGFKVGEAPITYHYRKFGKSKYGFRLFRRAFDDFVIILFVLKNLQKKRYKIKQVLSKKRNAQ